MPARALVVCKGMKGAGAGPEWVESNLMTNPTMSKSSLLSKERAADDRPDRHDHADDPPGDLPAEPNPEHPRLYQREARRVFKRVKAGMYDGSDLGAREWGLLAYWYPDVVGLNGGDPS